MALDPNVKMMLDQMASIGAPPVHTLSVEQARASMDAMVAMMGEGEEVADVEDRTIDAGGQQLPIRIYRPVGVSTDAAAGARLLPRRRVRAGRADLARPRLPGARQPG